MVALNVEKREEEKYNYFTFLPKAVNRDFIIVTIFYLIPFGCTTNKVKEILILLLPLILKQFKHSKQRSYKYSLSVLK